VKAPRVVLVDSREQRPLPLAHVIRETGLHFEVQRAALATGDYCLADAPHLCLIERKSLPDLAHVVGARRERFERELARLKAECTLPVLLVEGHVADVLRHDYPGTVHPNAVVGSVASWAIDFGLRVFWCGTPLEAAHVALRIFGTVARRVERGELAAG
ncbi:MAG: ERCC4 domain-containing protein, partial [Planctomycetes bacterium]|nr:ERCC4 domain-containing protein [Planctomycetota bacterium]